MEDNLNKIQGPDATENKSCLDCERPQCSCGNNEDYIDRLISCITKEVLNKLGY